MKFIATDAGYRALGNFENEIDAVLRPEVHTIRGVYLSRQNRPALAIDLNESAEHPTERVHAVKIRTRLPPGSSSLQFASSSTARLPSRHHPVDDRVFNHTHDEVRTGFFKARIRK